MSFLHNDQLQYHIILLHPTHPLLLCILFLHNDHFYTATPHSFFRYHFCTTTNFNTTILLLHPTHSFFVYHFCTTTNFNTTIILLHPTPSLDIMSAQRPTSIPLRIIQLHPTPSLFISSAQRLINSNKYS